MRLLSLAAALALAPVKALALEPASAETVSQENAEMLRIGDPAPDFSFTAIDGQSRCLRDLLAAGPVVIYFYPADFTNVCTRQACMFRDAHRDLVEAGVQVVGISPQGEESHDRFRRENSLPFPLVADTGRSIIRAYGVSGPFGLGVRRASFLVGTDGRVVDLVLADLRVGPHEDFVRRTLERVRSEPPRD